MHYERERPGELVHVDVKKVARIPDGGGHRALGRGCGSAYRPAAFAGELASRGIGHKFTRPFSPWQDGKAERMNRTLAQEWQYARARESEGARSEDPAPHLEHYNWERPHSACGGLPPMSRILGVNNVMAHSS